MQWQLRKNQISILCSYQSCHPIGCNKPCSKLASGSWLCSHGDLSLSSAGGRADTEPMGDRSGEPVREQGWAEGGKGWICPQGWCVGTQHPWAEERNHWSKVLRTLSSLSLTGSNFLLVLFFSLSFCCFFPSFLCLCFLSFHVCVFFII